jgi:hypothetical protein
MTNTTTIQAITNTALIATVGSFTLSPLDTLRTVTHITYFRYHLLKAPEPLLLTPQLEMSIEQIGQENSYSGGDPIHFGFHVDIKREK